PALPPPPRSTTFPYTTLFRSLGPSAQAWFDRYKERYKVDPNIGAIYGHVAADLTAVALEKAGPELTLDTFVRAMESISGYRDILDRKSTRLNSSHLGISYAVF